MLKVFERLCQVIIFSVGHGVLICSVLIMMQLFFMLSFFDYRIVVCSNSFGEHWLEFCVCLFGCLCLFFYYVGRWFRFVVKKVV